MKLNRSVVLAAALVICAGLIIGGTIAFFTDSASNVNTFVVAQGVSIRLDEAQVEKVGDEYVPVTPENRVEQNTYAGIYPGAVMPKDPTITLENTSEDAYVRAFVTVENGNQWIHVYGGATLEEGFMLLTCNTLGEGWTLVSAEAVENSLVYTLLYNDRLTAGQSTAPIFTQVTFTDKVDAETLPLFNGQFVITVEGEAIQAAGFESAQAAFATADGVSSNIGVDDPDVDSTDPSVEDGNG
ncbi:MAG: hypothetical protein E7324_05175 [Clostridiales bacterium]|nr:hypothetical protein [Clostridiales bacterium]